MRAMRFGIQTGPQHVTWQELVDIWQVADGLKFDTAWTFDHFFPIMSDPRGPQLVGRDVETIEKSVNLPPVLSKDPSKVDAMITDVANRRGMNMDEARVAMLWGSPDQAIEKLRAYRAVGVTHIILSLRAPYNASQLEMFAKEVIPALREPVPVR